MIWVKLDGFSWAVLMSVTVVFFLFTYSDASKSRA
jgi:hypothetical protein